MIGAKALSFLNLRREATAEKQRRFLFIILGAGRELAEASAQGRSITAIKLRSVKLFLAKIGLPKSGCLPAIIARDVREGGPLSQRERQRNNFVTKDGLPGGIWPGYGYRFLMQTQGEKI